MKIVGYTPTMRASFIVVSSDERSITIRDMSGENGGKTITNDADAVVEFLDSRWPGRRIYYYDTEGALDELQHVAGRFCGFLPGTRC